MSAREGARIVLADLGALQAGQRLCIVGDAETRAVAELFAEVGRELEASVERVEIGDLEMHGEEPPDGARAAMLAGDLVVGLTQRSMAHTEARRAACDAGARYLSLPEYSLELLSHPALRVDYAAAGEPARRLAAALTAGEHVAVRTAAGTDLRLDVGGRTGNFCPGWVSDECELGSPPDIETNVAPREGASEGRVVVDGSIPFPGFGLLDAPIELEVRAGRIVAIDGPPAQVDRLEALFAEREPAARVLAELGVGFNPAAELCGVMLVDEGALGTCHLGFGSNATIGGNNAVDFHLDFVFRGGELVIDDRPWTA